jgi:hypothetical protein
VEAPQLRPLGVGDIVDRVFTLYRGRPGLFLALAAIPYLVFFIVLGLIGVAFATTFVSLGAFAELATATPSRPPAITPTLISALVGALFFGIIAIVLAIVIFSVQSAALVDVAAARHLGRDATLGGAFRAGLRAAPRVIGAGMLAFFALLVLWVVLAIAMAISNSGWVVFLGGLGGLVFTVFVGISWVIAPAVATLEPIGPLHALRRSWFLSTGHRWRILGLQLLLLILNLVVSSLFSLVFISEVLIGDQVVRFVLQQGVSLIANIAWAPIQWATLAVLYFDLRVRKEALDLQLAAEALPREA